MIPWNRIQPTCRTVGKISLRMKTRRCRANKHLWSRAFMNNKPTNPTHPTNPAAPNQKAKPEWATPNPKKTVKCASKSVTQSSCKRLIDSWITIMSFSRSAPEELSFFRPTKDFFPSSREKHVRPLFYMCFAWCKRERGGLKWLHAIFLCWGLLDLRGFWAWFCNELSGGLQNAF